MMKWCLSLQNDDLHVKVVHIRPRTLTLEIPQATVEGSRNIDVISRWRNDWQSATVIGQFQLSGRPLNPTPRFRPSPASVVTAESFSNGSGPLQYVLQEMGFHWQRTMWLVKPKQCRISSTLVHWPSSTADYCVNWLTTWLLAYNNNEVAAAKLRVTTLEHVKSVRAQPSRVLSAAITEQQMKNVRSWDARIPWQEILDGTLTISVFLISV